MVGESQVTVSTDIAPIPEGTAGGRAVARTRLEWRGTVRAIAREPLTHFLAAGVLLLILSSAIGRTTLLGPPNRIVVPASTIQQLQDTWSARWGNAPTAAQLQSLIDDHVREEILYREALTSGLDRDDTIIRRHLAQKVEFLAQGVATAVEPTDDELRGFFEKNKAAYAVPAKVAFAHVYFSSSTRGVRAAAAAREALTRVRNNSLAAADAGDAFMLQSEYPLKTQAEVRELFGADFARALFELPTEGWQGPIASSYGQHLVRILQAEPARDAALDDVLPQVIVDFKDRRERSAVQAYYERIRQRYRVDVEQPAGTR